jgi:hypothetical protein
MSSKKFEMCRFKIELIKLLFSLQQVIVYLTVIYTWRGIMEKLRPEAFNLQLYSYFRATV